jgi:hypothetical protein
VIPDKPKRQRPLSETRKCSFHQKTVEYLGVIIGKGKVRMNPVKVQGIAQWPTPQTVKDVRSFLGFCNFYRAFVKNFSHQTRPLNDLTQKLNKWTWGEKEQNAFDSLKNACTSYPVLRTPDWTKLFILETDTSGIALGLSLGAVIAQEHEDGIHPIVFFSRSLLEAERNYDAHDLELAGVIFGFKNGRSYFLGAQHPIRVRTDHKNLQYFRGPHKVTGRHARWLKFLQDFEYLLTHIPGNTNTVADRLSRRKDLNKGVDTTTHTLLPDELFICKIFFKMTRTHDD